MRDYYNAISSVGLCSRVVEGPILRGYYNNIPFRDISIEVVEGSVLKGYYNVEIVHNFTRFVVEGPVLKFYYNTGNGSKFEGTIHVYFFLAIPIISSYLCSVNHWSHPGD